MQVVWASSKRLGIGKATTTLDSMLCTWVVALYAPSGDMRNMQKENVFIGLFEYQYCDTFGKGGGGKGSSSGTVHNMADTKIAAPAGSDQHAKKKSHLSPDSESEASKRQMFKSGNKLSYEERTTKLHEEPLLHRNTLFQTRTTAQNDIRSVKTSMHTYADSKPQSIHTGVHQASTFKSNNYLKMHKKIKKKAAHIHKKNKRHKRHHYHHHHHFHHDHRHKTKLSVLNIN